MNSENHPHKESGNATLAALIILALMTVMGRVASNTTMTELLISSNTRDYHKDFFVADGGLNMESRFTSSYPITLTVSEQKTHAPYYIVKSEGTYFTDIDSTDTTTLNATTHNVGSHEYKYAVQFVKRLQANMKGEGARTVDIIFNEISTTIPDSVTLTAQTYRRVSN